MPSEGTIILIFAALIWAAILTYHELRRDLRIKHIELRHLKQEGERIYRSFPAVEYVFGNGNGEEITKSPHDEQLKIDIADWTSRVYRCLNSKYRTNRWPEYFGDTTEIGSVEAIRSSLTSYMEFRLERLEVIISKV